LGKKGVFGKDAIARKKERKEERKKERKTFQSKTFQSGVSFFLAERTWRSRVLT